MKNILVATVLSLSMATNVCAQVQPAIPSDARIEKKVESLLKKMTLEEKVGQMCEITIDVITDFSSPNDFKLSEALLDTVIGKYKIGSILNVPLSVAQTKEKWAETIRQIQEKSLQEIGIPCTPFVRNICLRDKSLLYPLDICSCYGPGTRSALAAYVGKLW